MDHLDVDRVRISYIDQMNNTEERLQELRERYYFECDCPRYDLVSFYSTAPGSPSSPCLCRCTNGDPGRHRYAMACPSCSSPIAMTVRDQV